MAAPAGYLYGMRGGRPSGLELDGIVVGGIFGFQLVPCVKAQGFPCNASLQVAGHAAPLRCFS